MNKVYVFIFVFLLFITGCASVSNSGPADFGIYREGYSIQVGAFKNPNNAGRFVDSLIDRGLDAFMFRDGDIYKVRFGSYRTIEDARNRGKQLQAQGRIGEFFVVIPESYALHKSRSAPTKKQGSNYLRNEIVKTAYKSPILYASARVLYNTRADSFNEIYVLLHLSLLTKFFTALL